MKYTFLMPAYKRANLKEAITSILNQTYPDFRLIVSDDCSPENLKEIVDAFDDTRLAYRKNGSNLGGKNLIAHWNLLLDLAGSEYVILAPDDDFYSPLFLEAIDSLTQKYPQVDVFKSRSQDVDANGTPYKLDPEYPELMSQLDNIHSLTRPNCISGIGNYVFRRKALISLGGFVDYPLAWWSDVMTHILLSENGIAVTKDILFSFRHFDGNISSRHSSAKERRQKTAATLMFCNDIKEVEERLPLSGEDDQIKLSEWRRNIKNIKLQSIYSSAAVSSLKENFDFIKSYPDIFGSFKSRIKLFRYWLTKDWIVSLVTKLRR